MMPVARSATNVNARLGSEESLSRATSASGGSPADRNRWYRDWSDRLWKNARQSRDVFAGGLPDARDRSVAQHEPLADIVSAGQRRGNRMHDALLSTVMPLSGMPSVP